MSHDEDLVFLALGGAGEIGMNLYLYGHGRGDARRWIMVDCGVGFGDMETAPGIEIVMPDPAFIAERADRLEAVFLTHAHEDHIGAISRFWPRLRAPVYARPFTALHVTRKFEEDGADVSAVRVVTEPAKAIEAGPFRVRFQPVTHSIPEASALIIDTPSGRIVHTGDFKVDAAPQLGPAFDHAAFEALGREGVHALVCDSTNVFLDGHGGSEADVMGALADAIRTAKGAVAATTFASNVARLRTLALLAREAGREVVLAGRAMHRMIAAAREAGILTDFPDTVSEDEAKSIPSEHLFYLITGSQGEGRAALARIAAGTHPTVSLGEGDLVIFSSKTIPGNEAGVARLCNQLSERGVRVLEEDDPLRTGRIHVSGHARREDLRAMYDALKPTIAVPMHGEHRHLVEHAAFAESLGAHSVAAPNGTLVALGGARPAIIDEVPTGRIFLDGRSQIGAMDGVVRERLKLARTGHVVAALVVDEEGALLADPEIRVLGGPERAEGWPAPLEDMIRDEVDEAVESAPRKQRDDAGLEQIAARAARRVCVRWWGKKPVATVIVTRLED